MTRNSRSGRNDDVGDRWIGGLVSHGGMLQLLSEQTEISRQLRTCYRRYGVRISVGGPEGKFLLHGISVAPITMWKDTSTYDNRLVRMCSPGWKHGLHHIVLPVATSVPS